MATEARQRPAGPGERLRRLAAAWRQAWAIRQPLDRLAWVHATSALGDALVAVALAGTLFFAVPVAAARPRVALYLLLTVAPFAVVAPLLGRLLDGRRGAGRLVLAGALLLRAVLAYLAVPRTGSLLLYPLAFGLLVCSRVHGISRSALVPELAAAGRGRPRLTGAPPWCSPDPSGADPSGPSSSIGISSAASTSSTSTSTGPGAAPAARAAVGAASSRTTRPSTATTAV